MFCFNPCNFAGKTSWILCGVFQAVVCELPEWCKDDRISLTNPSLESQCCLNVFQFVMIGLMILRFLVSSVFSTRIEQPGQTRRLRSIHWVCLSVCDRQSVGITWPFVWTWGKHGENTCCSLSTMSSVCRRGPLGGGCVRHEESSRLDFLHLV